MFTLPPRTVPSRELLPSDVANKLEDAITHSFQHACVKLTVDVHPDGLDGRRAEAVLSLAVVSTTLGPQDLCDMQCLIKDAGVLEAVRHTSGCLGPSDLAVKRGKILNDSTLYYSMSTLVFTQWITKKCGVM